MVCVSISSTATATARWTVTLINIGLFVMLMMVISSYPGSKGFLTSIDDNGDAGDQLLSKVLLVGLFDFV